MKRIVSAAAALLVSLSACTRFETVPGDPLGTQMYTLDNGLKVFMTVNKEQPRIQTYIAVKVGGKNDPSETTGLAHYFEHLMFKGSSHFGTSDYEKEKPMLDEIEALFEQYRQTTDEAARAAIYHRIDSISYEASKIAIPNEYDKLMAAIGAEGTNAWTSHDETVYTEDIPSNQVDNWARIQADRFRNTVVRGFHTELETIYEEKNMSLTQDSRKVWEALSAALTPNHPYGKQTVLGTQEHLKNPSITNVKKYHDTYYVPNNIAICLSGDFNPREVVKSIEKYFGDWEPNPSIPELQFEKDSAPTAPVVKNVYGLEAENIAMGWLIPGFPDIESSAVAEVAGGILYNGQAGLVDLDLNQQQKVLYAYAGCDISPDYGSFIAMAGPKEGQSLEELRDLMLAEVAKLRAGEFDENLLKAVVNNYKLDLMRGMEDNSTRAHAYVQAFIGGISWKDYLHEQELIENVTKDDVVAWANKYLSDESYAVVYKRMGEDKTVKKIAAPKITPIVTNRDMRSDFLASVQETPVKPIEPVFLDFSSEMDHFNITEGVEVLYKKNELNDLFEISFVFNRGKESYPALGMAFDYLQYLGTGSRSAADIASRMYELACSFNFYVGNSRTSVNVSGLSENMKEAVSLVEELIFNAEPSEDVLSGLKADTFKARANAKTNQRACFSALNRYVSYGADAVRKTTMSNAEVSSLTSESLLAAVRDLFAKGHEIMYYGPESEKSLKTSIAACHTIAPDAAQMEPAFLSHVLTESNSVVMAQYDSKQLYYYQYSDRGENFDADSAPVLALYNEYFGGGMNSVVFQEMREARGLAYSAWTNLYFPSFKGDTYYYSAFIATQNDKMRSAVEAFDSIINDMPESDAAFNIAVSGIEARLRTQRYTGRNVLDMYLDCKDKGLAEPLDRQLFESLGSLTLADVKAAQEKWVKGRPYTYAILGDIADLDMTYLKTLGPVKVVSLEEIFGY